MSAKILTDKRQTANDLFGYTTYAAALGLLALVVLLSYIDLGDLQTNSYRLITGENIDRPFIYRAMIPLLSRWLAHCLPDRAIETILNNPALGAAAKSLGGPWPAGGVACLLILYISLLAALVGLLLILDKFNFPRRWWLLAPPLALAGLLLLFSSYAFIYDIPAWALWTLAILAMAYQHHDSYLALFAAANMTKETSLLLIPVWIAVTWPDRHRPDWPRRLAEQIAVAIVTRGVLLIAYHDWPGRVVQWHLPDQLLSYQGKPYAFVMSLIVGAFTAALVAWGWNSKPAFLRRSMIAAAPPMILLYILFGTPGEIRVFLELTPIVLPLMIWRPKL